MRPTATKQIFRQIRSVSTASAGGKPHYQVTGHIPQLICDIYIGYPQNRQNTCRNISHMFSERLIV